MEVRCREKNFLHLSGVKYINRDIRVQANRQNYEEVYAKHFFNLAMDSRLNINHCFYKDDGTTTLKLGILSHIFNFPYNATMIGNFNNSKPRLYTKKICGGITSCIGFVNGNDGLFFS